MQTRRQALQTSVAVAAVAGTVVSMPQAQAAYDKNAFASKSVQEAVKAMGGNTMTESADVKIVGPDIAENGAVVPMGVASSLAGVKKLLLLI